MFGLTEHVVNVENPGEVAGDEPRSIDSVRRCTRYWRLRPSLSSWKNVCKTLTLWMFD